MTPDQPSDPGPAPQERRARPPSRRRGRRSGRGRRPRAPGSAQPSTPEPATAEEKPAAEPAPTAEPAPAEETMPAAELAPVVEPEISSPPAPEPTAGRPGTVQDAIEEVNKIIGALRESLDDMEDVLEMLEHAERQRNADEREIESLRRSLRQLHRPHEGGRHQAPRHSNQEHTRQ